MTLHVFLEEPSAEYVLRSLLPRMVGREHEFFVFRGKQDLMRRLPDRLRGYAGWAVSAGVRIVVLVDRDDDDCTELKGRMEKAATTAGFTTGVAGTVLNRIVVTELESWLLGDVPALRQAYPRLPEGLAAQARFRDPEDVRGGCWEAVELMLKQHGYHLAGLRKGQLAKDVAQHMDVENNRAASFAAFRDGVRRLVGEV
jgi:hypothetical protein